MIGALQANEAIKIITGSGEVLSGILLRYNALTNEFLRFNFGKTFLGNLYQDDNSHSKTKIKAITAHEFLANKHQFFLMDVRSEEEHEKNNLGGIHVPLYEIDEWKIGRAHV